MAPNVEVKDLAATCGHAQTGSSEVFANGFGVSRAKEDTAVGLINGPGSQSVFVEGFSVSLPGDLIIPHPPCGNPDPPHCNAKTNAAGTPNVFAGIGFTIGPGGGPGEPVGLDAPDLKVVYLEAVPSTAVANYGIPHLFVGTVNFIYTIENFAHDAVAFTIGFWKTDGVGPWILPRYAEGAVPGATLLQEIRLEGTPQNPAIPAGESYEGEFSLTSTADDLIVDWSVNNPPNWYAVYPDIDEELIEPDEDNSAASVSFTVVL